MSMRKWCGLSAVLAALGLAAPAGAQIKLIFSTYVPATYSVTACDGVFMDEVTKRTGGKVVFERYYASALLSAVDTVPGIGRGAADLGMGFPGGYNRAQYPISNIVMPWTTDNFAAAIKAINQLYRESPDFQAEYERQNVKLFYSLIPPAHSFYSRTPILTAADFKGKRVRGVLAIGDSVAKLGGTPVGMQWPDGVEALTRGAIDAMGNVPFDLGVTAGLQKVAKHVTDAGRMGTFSLSATVINLKKWNSLPADVQQTMLEVAKEAPDCFIKTAQRDVEKAVDALIADKSVSVTTFAPEEAKRLRETVGRELWQEWVGVVGKAGYDGQKLLDRYLQLIAANEKDSPVETGFDLYRKRTGK